MTEQKNVATLDGRRLRSERSKQAIIDACIDLSAEGNLVPTAQQISDRAGILIRSFFRHFEDMEALFIAIDEVKREWFESFFPLPDKEESFDQRLHKILDHHGVGYEKMASVIKSTLAQRWRYQFLRENYARNQRGLRKNLDAWLPELANIASEDREAIDALTSFEMWDRLRTDQQLSIEASQQMLFRLIKVIVV